MRYADIIKCDCENGKHWGVSLFTQGCPFHCEGCFNPETWSYDSGKEFTDETQTLILKLLDKSYISRLSILGGEPLEERNLHQLACLISSIRNNYHNDIKIWVYTGWTYEELQRREKESNIKYLTFILDNIDYLVDGPFIQEKKDITLEFRGSRNQRILDTRQLRKDNKVVL